MVDVDFSRVPVDYSEDCVGTSDNFLIKKIGEFEIYRYETGMGPHIFCKRNGKDVSSFCVSDDGDVLTSIKNISEDLNFASFTVPEWVAWVEECNKIITKPYG